jgi:N-acetylmuramoyl-L-alanine amidase
MNSISCAWALPFALLIASAALASEDSVPGVSPHWPDLQDAQKLSPDFSLSPAEAFRRTRVVLEHFGVPAEPDSSAYVRHLDGLQTRSGALSLLKKVDPHTQWPRFSRIGSGAPSLDVFQDRDGFGADDFSVALAGDGQAQPSTRFHDRMLQAKSNPPGRPLQGLRIALDPGHMGGAVWDERTGKYVRHNGVLLSEGVMAVQTALLLEKELRALGAEVLITHRSLGPVTSETWENIDLQKWGEVELRADSLQPWFVNLLGATSSDSDVLQSFDKSSQAKAIFADTLATRSRYFILRSDLDARVAAIQSYDPDLTLVIHFDADINDVHPGKTSSTKVYVTGGLNETEFASRADRRYFADHLLDAHAWDGSLRLGRRIVSQLHDQLNLPYDSTGGDEAYLVEPGIFSRNLAVSRKLTGHAVTYLEILHYNAPAEFAALSNRTHPMSIDGQNYPYSDRLALAVRAIRDGIVQFAREY